MDIYSIWLRADALFFSAPEEAAKLYTSIFNKQRSNYMLLFNIAALRRNISSKQAAAMDLQKACMYCSSEEHSEAMYEVFWEVQPTAERTLFSSSVEALRKRGFFCIELFKESESGALARWPAPASTPDPTLSVEGSISGLHHLATGTMLEGRYVIEHLLGVGGFGVVYEARDCKSAQAGAEDRVAIKVMLKNEQLDTATYQSIIRRFEQEARITSKLKHPNIVEVRGWGRLSSVLPPRGNSSASDVCNAFIGQPYMVMERLIGAPLFQRPPMEPTRALRLLIPCLKALSIAHARGIIHKDINLQNLYLADQEWPERLYLIDFGGAAVVGSDIGTNGRLTGIHQRLGVLRYMTPEYLTRGEISPAGDVYQMGLVLCEMMTGRFPFEAENEFAIEKLKHIRKPDLPPALIEGPLGRALLKALDPIPARRYRDAWMFAKVLEQLPADQLPSLEMMHSNMSASSFNASSSPLTGAAGLPGVAPLLREFHKPEGLQLLIVMAVCIVVVFAVTMGLLLKGMA